MWRPIAGSRSSARAHKLVPSISTTRSCGIYHPHLFHLAAIVSARGSTLVVSAGNDRTSVGRAKKRAARLQKIVAASSLDARGFPADYTSYFEQMTIAVPSKAMWSYDYSGAIRTFGGTSGAAPQVTGALTSFTLLSSYPLATRETHLVLSKTAIPLPGLPKSSLVGPGMLNAYKIGMVAKRLKAQCAGDQGHECMNRLLRREQTYHFARESAQLLERGLQFFPECRHQRALPASDNCHKAAAFEQLRRAAFLEPSNKRAWQAIACIKKRYFETKNAISYYHSLAERVGKRREELLGGYLPRARKTLPGRISRRKITGPDRGQPAMLPPEPWPPLPPARSFPQPTGSRSPRTY